MSRNQWSLKMSGNPINMKNMNDKELKDLGNKLFAART